MSSTNLTALTSGEERLLNTLIDKGVRETNPRRTDHTIVYAGLEELTGELGSREVNKLLRGLVSKAYLKEKSYDSVVSCPNCESSSILSKYSCPQCESLNVQKVQLIEHMLCGYIGNRSEFESDGDIICPKCKTQIGSFTEAKSKNIGEKSKAIRIVGSNYLCNRCGSKFEKPTIAHVCEQCSTTFTFREANYERLPSYELTEKVDGLAPNRFVMDELRKIEKILNEKGYTVELDAKISGKSGITQHFDLTALRNGKRLLLDVSPWGKQTDLISLLGKRTDVDSQSIILLDLAGNPDLASLGKPYNISVLNSKDEKYLEKLAGLLPDAGKKEDEKRGRPFTWRGKKDQ